MCKQTVTLMSDDRNDDRQPTNCSTCGCNNSVHPETRFWQEAGNAALLMGTCDACGSTTTIERVELPTWLTLSQVIHSLSLYHELD